MKAMTKVDTPTNAANPELVNQVAATQEPVKRLWHEPETSHQTVQRQQILIETLTVQLESSQERVAQLEREFALTQQRYNEQSYQLVQTENTCRELRTRLSQQQSHTLQLKVALEKCLEVPLPHHQFQADAEPSASLSPVARPLHNFKTGPELPPLLLSKAQPIPAWSAQSESNQEEFSLPELTTDLEELHTLESDISEAEEAQAQYLFRPLEAGAEPITANLLEQVSLNQTDQPELPQTETNCFTLNVPPESAPAAAMSKLNTNWPSPVVYPLRPPKGRKSFATVELPTF